MGGQSVVLLAIGVFTSLVVAVAGVHQYLLEQNPPSEAGGLLWRAENALAAAQDLQIEVSSIDHQASDAAVRMIVRVLVRPIPALSIVYTEPEALAGQIVVVQNDLLSHYLPAADMLVVKRWSGIPLAAVGLAGLDVSRLRTAVTQGTMTARVIEDIADISSIGSGASFSLGPADATTSGGVPGDSVFAPSLLGFAPSLAADAATPTRRSHVIEVRDAATGNLVQVLWIDRGTYFVRKVTYYHGDRLARTIEVERLLINQGLTSEDVLAVPRAGVTVRG